jgi:hypothetical protein
MSSQSGLKLSTDSSCVSFNAVDRDEVDRLRKRFMKLDKVRGESRLGCDEVLLTGELRTILARSREKSFSRYPKYLPILWRQGTSFYTFWWIYKSDFGCETG